MSRPTRLSASVLVLLCTVLACAPSRPVETAPDCVGEAGCADYATLAAAQADGPDADPAPSLDGGTAWLNVDRPLTLEDLRGHVVILDFWTYCCINCMHVIPELQRVERRFADKPVVVIGVHSGKFDAEKDATRIRSAMARHGVRHPVVVDSEYAIWDRYGVRAWPTLVVIDPDGDVVGASPGEPPAGGLEKLVGELVALYEHHGKLAKQRIELPDVQLGSGQPLAFPGKVAVASDGSIAISDSGHHRVVVTDAEGTVREVIGSGIAGSADGGFVSAGFRYPQGLAFSADDDTLYVADTENHQIRAIDLRARRVRTLAGTGQKAERMRSGPGREVSLRSPWGLVRRGRTLYVAMAGSHQIWTLDLETHAVARLAGTGRENIDDGAFAEATFSQPSGLALVDDRLYVADSEVSAVRELDLSGGEVRTLVGKGLFEFGDRDGDFEAARLQHALGIVADDGGLIVADTFNDKLKRLDLVKREVVTLAGGDGALSEPGGLAWLADGGLLVADTNNHRLRRFDPATSVLGDFPVTGLSAPTTSGLILATGTASQRGHAAGARSVVATGKLGPGLGTLVVDVVAPTGGKLTAGAPIALTARAAGTGVSLPTPRQRHKLGEGVLPLRLPIQAAANAGGTIELTLEYFWCTSGDASACVPEHVELEVSVDWTGDAGGTAVLRHQAEL